MPQAVIWKNSSSAQNLTVSPQIVVVNKYCVCVWEIHWQTAYSYMERGNCQEGIEAKAKRNIRAIYLRLGEKKKIFPLSFSFSPCLGEPQPWTVPKPLPRAGNTVEIPSSTRGLIALRSPRPTCPPLPPAAHHTARFLSVVFIKLLRQPPNTFRERTLPGEMGRCYHTCEKRRIQPGLPQPFSLLLLLTILPHRLSQAVQLNPRTPSVCFHCDGYKTRSSIFKE